MNLRILPVVFVLVPALAVVPLGCKQPDDTTQQPTSLPPLVVDKNAPLLLDAPIETEHPPTEAETKNATCFVCHANYEQEPLALRHAKANLGCSNCHGQSIAHKNDENHLTPPDKMYPPNEIDSACRKCHATHDVQPAAVVRRWKQRIGDKKSDVLCKECHESHDIPAAAVIRKWQQRTSQKTNDKLIVCTDCHGQHRLNRRSVRWDKKTEKLLPPTK
jgi:hypothetical protein